MITPMIGVTTSTLMPVVYGQPRRRPSRICSYIWSFTVKPNDCICCDLLIERRLLAGLGRHRQRREERDDDRRQRQHAEPLRRGGDAGERLARRDDDADETREKILRGRRLSPQLPLCWS